MPTGKVKWFDAEKGFGFLSQEDGADVYVRSDALPEGVTTLKAGTRVEFGIAQGRKRRPGPPGPHPRRAGVGRAEPVARPAQEARGDGPHRRGPDPAARGRRARPTAHGRHPDAKTAKPTAKLLRALADELEL